MFSAAATLTRQERERLLRMFVLGVRGLTRASAYWCPVRRVIILRRPSGSPFHAVPLGAVFLGDYDAPFMVDRFLRDLDAVMGRGAADDPRNGAGL